MEEGKETKSKEIREGRVKKKGQWFMERNK